MSVKLTDQKSVPAASVKLAVTVGAGLIAGLAVGIIISWAAAPLAAWDTAALVFMLATWPRILNYGPDLVKRHALREDPSRAVADLVLLAASLASLAAVALLLIEASHRQGGTQVALTLFGIFSVIASWSVVHTIYALKYAEAYYARPEGGIDFSEKTGPVYSDFAYLAFTVGMTYQVSDTALKTGQFRSIALKHALLSFLLGTAIIATTINFVAGLGK